MKNKVYNFFLIGFSLVLFIPVLILPPWIYPPDWAKAVIFRIIFSCLLFVFVWQTEKFKDLFKKNIGLWFLLALFVVYFLASIFGVDPNFSFWGSPHRGGGFANYGMLIMLAIMMFLVVKKQDWQKLLDFSFFTGILVCLIALISYFKLFQNIFVPQKDALTSSMGSPNLLGLYLVLLIFPALSFALQEKNLIKKIFYFGCVALFSILILLTISQGAYLGMGLGALYFLFFYPKKIKIIKISAVLFILLALISIFVIKNLPENPINQHYLFRQIINWHLDQSRISAWKVSWQAFLQRPILGWGPENFSVGFDKNYDPALPAIQFDPATFGSWWDKAHNFIFQILVEAGIFGLLALLSLFGFLFWRLFKLKQLLPHAICATFVAYFADIFFNFDGFSSYLIIFVLIAYSLSLIYPREDTDIEKNKPIKTSGIKIFATTILFFVLILFLWQYNFIPFSVNTKLNIAQDLAEDKECEKAFLLLDKTLQNRSILDAYAISQYVKCSVSCNKFYPENNFIYTQKNAELLSKAVKIQPLYTRFWLALGSYKTSIAQAEQNPEIKKEILQEARNSLEKAIELAPKHQDILVEQIKTEIVSQNFTEALAIAEKCVSLSPLNQIFPECYFYRGVAKIYLKDDSAEEDLDFAINSESGTAIELRQINQAITLPELANAYGYVKNYQKLVPIFEELILLEPNNTQYFSTLAFLYKEIGNYQKARETALEIVEINPNLEEQVNQFLRTLY